MAEYIANNTMYQRTPDGVLPTSPWLALLQLARDFAVVSTTADDDPLADVPDDARHSHTVHTVYVLCNNIVKYPVIVSKTNKRGDGAVDPPAHVADYYYCVIPNIFN